MQLKVVVDNTPRDDGGKDVFCPKCGARSVWRLGGSWCFSAKCGGNTFVPGNDEAMQEYLAKRSANAQ